jgi:hypothetical protein
MKYICIYIYIYLWIYLYISTGLGQSDLHVCVYISGVVIPNASAVAHVRTAQFQVWLNHTYMFLFKRIRGKRTLTGRGRRGGGVLQELPRDRRGEIAVRGTPTCAWVSLSRRMYTSTSNRKSIPPQNRQLIAYDHWSKYEVDGCAGEMAF